MLLHRKKSKNLKDSMTTRFQHDEEEDKPEKRKIVDGQCFVRSERFKDLEEGAELMISLIDDIDISVKPL